MNNFWKITNRLFRNYRAYRQFTRTSRPLFFIRPSELIQICLTSSVIPHGKINVEDDLRKAVQEGEEAILSLMSELQSLIISVSCDYRTCLNRQIELIQSGAETFSELLLEHRNLANKLRDELHEYVILLKTIRDIAYEQSVISSMIDKKSLINILRKYKELEIMLLKEFEENKQTELQLLEINIIDIALSNN